MAERKQHPTTEGETKVLVYKMKCTSRSQIQTQNNKKANINVKKTLQFKRGVRSQITRLKLQKSFSIAFAYF